MLTLLCYRPSSFSHVNDVVVMLISKNLHKKSSEASLSVIVQVTLTKQTTVKWTI